MARDWKTEITALQQEVERLKQYMRALGIPISPWVSPQQAAQLMSTSRARITSEIDKAEHARIHGISYDLKWGVHYRKNGANWQINPVEFEAVIFLPPEQRPSINII